MAEQALSIEQRLGAVLNPEPAAPEKAPQAPQTEPEDDYTPSTAGATEGDDVAAQAAPEKAEEAPTWFPERLEDIAEAGGWQPADLYKVKVKVNGPDGKPVEVSIGEWKDAYQQSAQLDAIRRAERESHERAEAARKAAIEQINRQAVEVQGLAQAAEQRLLAKYQLVNWDQLRALDPAEWAAKRAELVEEYNQLTTIKHQAANAAQQQYQQQMAEQATTYQQYLREQVDQAKSLIPEFADAEKVPEVQKATVNWLRKEGYSDFEVGLVAHSAKLFKLVRDKMQLDAANTAGKKVAPSPKKFLKPGVAQQRGSKEAEAYKAERSKLRKSGRLDDATQVFKRILGG